MLHLVTALDNVFIRLNNRRPVQIMIGLAIVITLFFGAAIYLNDPNLFQPKFLFHIFFHLMNALLFFNLLALFAPVIVALWGAAYVAFHPSLTSSLFGSTSPQPHLYLIPLTMLISIITSHFLMRQNQQISVNALMLHSIVRYLAIAFILFRFPLGCLATPALLLFLWGIAQGIPQHIRIALGAVTLAATGLIIYFRDATLIMSLSPSVPTAYEFISNLFGLHWIPATWPLARMVWLVFWLVGLALLWRKNRHQKILAILGLLLITLSTAGILIEQYDYLCYVAIPCYLGILVVLYEHYEHADIKKFLNVLIIPLYGALIFSACQLFMILTGQ